MAEGNLKAAKIVAVPPPATLANKGPVAESAQVVHHGDKLILPERMAIPAAIDLLERRLKYLEEKCIISETFDAFPWDGAHALDAVLTERFGFACAEATPGFFGPTPPQMIGVEVALGQTRQVPWGSFSLPGVDGLLGCGVQNKNGRYLFQLSANVKRKDEATVRDICTDLREYLKTGSIYRGKAVRIRFKDDDGNLIAMPEPKFIDTDVNEAMLVYSREVNEAITTNLFTPIKRVADLLDNGIPVKRGVLLGGTFGTGKTLAAKVAGKLAVRQGITYLYVPRADELAQAIEFAKQYQSPACVVFCEDIDRAMSGDRSVEMDDILNIIDGIDTKTSNIIVVLTSNDLSAINPAMLRPGRLDAVIEVTPPDAEAVEKLIRVYAGPTLAANADLTEAGRALEGCIPAVIAEVVKRAKLSQLSMNAPGERVKEITGPAIVSAAKSMANQLRLLNRRPPVEPPHLEHALADVIRKAVEPIRELADGIDTTVDEIHGRVN